MIDMDTQNLGKRIMKMNKLEGLDQFIGTQEWHKWSILFPRVLMTDGAMYVAETAEAFWLMDAIASYQPPLIKSNEYFQVWKLEVHDNNSATLLCEDGNDKCLIDQEIEYTDFPKQGIKLYAIYDGQYTVILLPSEY